MTNARKSTWITRNDFRFLVLMTFISFAIENTIGLVLLPILAMPLVGGLLSGFFDAALIFTSLYIVPRRGSALFFATLLLTLSILTPSFGPPGVYKVFIGLALGLWFEIVVSVGGRGMVAYGVATATGFAMSIPFTYFVWKLWSSPSTLMAAAAVEGKLAVFSVLYLGLGALGSLAGAWLYRARLSRSERIRLLRENTYAGDSPSKGA